MQNEVLQKVRMLQRVKFPEGHYHPDFLRRMVNNIFLGREIGYNARQVMERSFAKYFPGGVKYE